VDKCGKQNMASLGLHYSKTTLQNNSY